MTPCVFFDRDGIINVPSTRGPYLLDPAEFMLCPGIAAAMRVAQDAGYALCVVTNQKCVQKGLISEAELEKIHQRMRMLLEVEGVGLLDVAWCGDLNPDAPRLKPQPGMLLELADRYGLDLSQSWMIGDQVRDIEAGLAAGCPRTVLISETVRESPAGVHLAHTSELEALFKQALERA